MAEASQKKTLDESIEHHVRYGPASAREVKIADIISNSDPVRLAVLWKDEAALLGYLYHQAL